MSKIYEEYFNYYLVLEKDFFAMEPYLTIDKENFKAFSIQYNRIYQSICSEIDCLLKELCKQIDIKADRKNINDYRLIISSHFKNFANETVYFHQSEIELQPWKDCEVQTPIWWTYYNKVKHQRMDIDKESNKPYYKFANLENVLNALAALYIVEQYYIYSYNSLKEIPKTVVKQNQSTIDMEIAAQKEYALMRNKSSKCCMKQWEDAGCYQSFMGGEYSFDIRLLDMLIRGEI